MNTLLMLPYDYVMIIGFGPIGYLFCPVCQEYRVARWR